GRMEGCAVAQVDGRPGRGRDHDTAGDQVTRRTIVVKRVLEDEAQVADVVRTEAATRLNDRHTHAERCAAIKECFLKSEHLAIDLGLLTGAGKGNVGEVIVSDENTVYRARAFILRDLEPAAADDRHANGPATEGRSGCPPRNAYVYEP